MRHSQHPANLYTAPRTDRSGLRENSDFTFRRGERPTLKTHYVTAQHNSYHDFSANHGFIQPNHPPITPLQFWGEYRAEEATVQPAPARRVEYVPYQTQYVDYQVQQVVTDVLVPVTRKCIQHYAVEHITQYLPHQIEEARMQLVPEEQINMRLQYVPVQRKIVHYPQDQRQTQRAQWQQNYGSYQRYQQIQQPSSHVGGNNQTGEIRQNKIHIPGYQQVEGAPSSMGASRRTNFVTADNYVPRMLTEKYESTQKMTRINSRDPSETHSDY